MRYKDKKYYNNNKKLKICNTKLMITDKDLKNNYEETQLSFGFGSGVDIDAYIEKEDRDADNDQPKAGAKDTTEISFGETYTLRGIII